MNTKPLDPKELSELLAVQLEDEGTWTARMREDAQRERASCCIGAFVYSDGPAGDMQRKRELLYEGARGRWLGVAVWLQAAVDVLRAAYPQDSNEAKLLTQVSNRITELELDVLDACLDVAPELERVYKAPGEVVSILRARATESAAVMQNEQ